MALTIEEQHETNDLDHDILATREVTFMMFLARIPRPLWSRRNRLLLFNKVL